MATIIGRLILSVIDTIVRLAALGFVWAAAAYAVSPMVWGTMSPFGTMFIIFLVLPVALVLSHFVMQRKLLVADAPVVPPLTQAHTRQPVDNLSVRDLIALLDEDDLDDLRHEARETLRARIQRLSGDDVESFGDLLTSGGSKRKR